MLDASARSLRFPQIEQAKFTSFSLYARNPNPEIVFPKGVFCLAGANGLGKTTFLTTLNYALTGIVLDPERELSKSIEEYFNNIRDFSKRYFSGRIDEQDRETASVELRFSIGSNSYRIVRGLFEPAQLRELQIFRKGSSALLVDGSTMTAGQRHDEYKQLIVEDVGVKYFEQFAFLQHFVLTFDESRQLLFWHQQALEQALFLAFGGDFDEAQTADTLRRTVDREDSQARNLQWRATDVRSQLKTLTKAINADEQPTANDLSLGEEHQRLQEQVGQFRDRLIVTEAEVSDTELTIMKLSSERTSLQTEYGREFAQRVHRQSRAEFHPLVRSSLIAAQCGVCGTEGEKIVYHIRDDLDAHRCPLCRSPLEAEVEEEHAAKRLLEIDQELAQAEGILAETHQRHERLQAEVLIAEKQLEAVEEQLRRFEADNSDVLKRLVEPPTGVEESITTLRNLFENLMLRKNQAIRKRNEAREELKRHQKNVQLRYLTAEEHFLPELRNLAELFLGIDIDVSIDASGTMYGGLSLIVQLRNTPRRQAHQLSESQRFFLDIALRMALAKYISDESATASMMIDTPEGSLDIAYESRAGQMFARFVTLGHGLIMTANINTSQLLLRLAGECRNDRMELQRMTSWAELSDVQIEEEHLFEQAYDKIEKALFKGVDVSRI